MAKRLSIVIVTYNSERDVFDCVESIQRWADVPREELELIVVDNQSREPQAMFDRLREQWGEDIILIENTLNGGYGQGNNIGVRAATAPVCLIMNPDVRLYEPLFATALTTFDERLQVGMLGMVQMFSSTSKSKHSTSPSYLVNGYLLVALYAVCNRLDWYLPSCMYITGSCFFVRREMFLKAGAFDETNFMYGEEDDLHYRMKQRYGSRCFAFNKSLHYIHLAEHRAPSFDYEKRIIDASLALWRRNGVSVQRIVKHFLQANRLLLWRAARNKKDRERDEVLRATREYLKSLV